MSFLKDLVKASGNEYASIVNDGVAAGDVDGFIDTGSHIFNALLSGSLYGGLPSNKITAIAGESATGKTFFALGIVKQFLEDNKDAAVIYFESESAISRDMIEDRGIDSKRVVIVPVVTVQEFRNQAISILDKYAETPKDKRPPMMFCLDSLGMLSTTKEIEDTAEGKETKDMTRAQITKGAFRVLTLKLGRVGVPMIVTNHTYDVIGSMFPQKEMGGGSGLKYAASSIIYLSKRKEKEGTEIVGNIIHCKNAKSRLTVENRVVDVRLSYDKGLDRYYGLLDMALAFGVFEKSSTRVKLPNGKTEFGKTINNNPEKYFTPDVMEKLELVAKEHFKYGTTENRTNDTEESDSE
jgi:RecA/RadA recombinase|tara:strand:- start:982 stop:2037 length:1056 start_codon:yes stop_codon:yes gene_type:complete